jgi:capsid protein
MSTVTPPIGDAVYQALNPKNRRRATTSRVMLEDRLLTDRRREALSANALDVWRNMGLMAWAIRRTLDYCCLWDFQPRTKDRGLNDALKQLMARDTEPEAIDYYGRMDWDDMRRVAESQKLLAGDCFFVKMADGTLQMIEGSYCNNPSSARNTADTWLNGAKLKSGRVVAWNFTEEDPRTGQRKDKSVRNSSVWQHCQFEGRPNQIRPQSPIVAAINEFRDLDETFDHMRAKVKLDQLFGLAFKRAPDAEAFDEDDPAASDAQEGSARVVDFGDGPAVFDLDEGEDVTPVQSANPAASTQEFLKLCAQVALKSLDLPYNFFDEAHTNFFGSRAAWLLFERACYARRKTQDRLHRKMTISRFWRWTLPVELGGTGEITLPNSMQVQDLAFRWVPRGVAWWKPQEELDTALRSVAAGLKSMQDVCDEHGFGDYIDNVREIAGEREELASLGYVQKWSQQAMVYLADINEITTSDRPATAIDPQEYTEDEPEVPVDPAPDES